MRKSFKKEAERIEYAAAKDVFELEWEHAMNKYPDHRRGNGTFDHVCRLTCSKAFATVFKQKFLGSYERAYARATDKFMLSKNSALVWKYENEEVYYNRFTNKNCWMDEDFDKLLTKELKASLKIVHKEKQSTNGACTTSMDFVKCDKKFTNKSSCLQHQNEEHEDYGQFVC